MVSCACAACPSHSALPSRAAQVPLHVVDTRGGWPRWTPPAARCTSKRRVPPYTRSRDTTPGRERRPDLLYMLLQGHHLLALKEAALFREDLVLNMTPRH